MKLIRGIVKKSGFTLIELLIVIAVIGILAGILFSAFSGARERARRAACASNLKQIGLACHLYAHDRGQAFPWHWAVKASGATGYSNDSFYLLMPNYVKATNLFICRSDNTYRRSAADWTYFRSTQVNSYAYVAGLTEADRADSPLGGDSLVTVRNAYSYSSTVAQYKTVTDNTTGGGNHNKDGGNVLFVDGHVEFNNGTFLKVRWVDAYTETSNTPNNITRNPQYQ